MFREPDFSEDALAMSLQWFTRGRSADCARVSICAFWNNRLAIGCGSVMFEDICLELPCY